MPWLLLAIGISCIITAFFMNRKEQIEERDDFLRLQERFLHKAQESGAMELQALAADLSGELEEKAAGFFSEMEKKLAEIQKLLIAAAKESSSQKEDQPAAIVNNGTRPRVASGSWRQREEQILKMAALGMEAEAIAKELNIGKGEVKLVLNLAQSGGNCV